MKKAVLSIVLLIAFFSSFSQTFKLTDSVFKAGSYYRMHNVLFELGKAGLRPECFPDLDSVVTFLNANSTVKLEIDVHSDSRTRKITCGGNLSMNRAISIRDYFVSKKIESDRLKTVGYGGSKPLISEKEIIKMKTEEEKESAYQKNRRVEFKIIGS
jgi:OOP family OmpA-OmpF porin